MGCFVCHPLSGLAGGLKIGGVANRPQKGKQGKGEAMWGALQLHPAFSGRRMEPRHRPGTPTCCHSLLQAPAIQAESRLAGFQENQNVLLSQAGQGPGRQDSVVAWGLGTPYFEDIDRSLG